jgi:hypothetical protein
MKTTEELFIAAQFILLLIKRDRINKLDVENLFPQLERDKKNEMFEGILEINLMTLNHEASSYKYKKPVEITIYVSNNNNV